MAKVKASFSYKNYFKPTPTNLQYWIEGIKGVLVTVAATQFVMDDPKLTVYFLVAAGVLDYLSKFFAKVAKDIENDITPDGEQVS